MRRRLGTAAWPTALGLLLLLALGVAAYFLVLRQSSMTVGPEGGTFKRHGVVLEIPAGAVTEEAPVTIEPSSEDATKLFPGTRSLSRAFAVTVEAALRRPVRLELPLSRRPRQPAAATMANREGSPGMWVLRRGHYDSEAEALVVPTDDLSFNQVLEPIGDVASRAGDAAVNAGVTATSELLRLGGVRVSEPTCGEAPVGFGLTGDTGVGDRNALIFACLEATGEDMALKVANNRAIGMEFGQPTGMRVTRSRGPKLADELVDAVRSVLDKESWKSISATGEVTLTGAAGPVELRVKPTLRAFAFDLAVFAVSQSGEDVLEAAGTVIDYVDCVRQAVNGLENGPPESPRAAFDAALAVWRECGDTLVKALPDADKLSRKDAKKGRRAAARGQLARTGAAFFGGFKLGGGSIDALAALLQDQEAKLAVEEVAVGAGTSCGQVTARVAGGREASANLVVDQGQMKCSLARALWERYWANPDAPCEEQGAGTCWRSIRGWRCVVPTAGASPEVFSCSENRGEGELRGYDQSAGQGGEGDQASTGPRSCGDLAESGAGVYGVKSVNVECGLARRVASEWQSECASQPSGSCSVSAGFACSYRDTGHEAGAISCADGERRVTFETGA